MTIFAVFFGLALIGGLGAALWGWFRDLPRSIPGPATPFQAQAIAEMKDAVKAQQTPLSEPEKAAIALGDDFQAGRLGYTHPFDIPENL